MVTDVGFVDRTWTCVRELPHHSGLLEKRRTSTVWPPKTTGHGVQRSRGTTTMPLPRLLEGARVSYADAGGVVVSLSSFGLRCTSSLAILSEWWRGSMHLVNDQSIGR